MSGDLSEIWPTELLVRCTRYTPAGYGCLARIERALGAIRAAPILPAAADQLRASARAGTVHYSTLIEGNVLPLIEAQRAAEGTLEADTIAKIELVNYVTALDFLDEHLRQKTLEITPDLLLALHGVLMKDLGREDSHFKPHHEGAWRDGIAVVHDPIANVAMHVGANKDEVPGRMLGLCDWLAARREREAEYPPPVLAAVVHYAITDIHPFADGNGRSARLAATAILMSRGYAPERLFCFDAYYAQDRNAYLAALRSVANRTLNMDQWIEYFLAGLAEEYERVHAEVDQLGKLGLGGGAPTQLKPSQQRALSSLAIQGVREFTRRDYEKLAEVSESTALVDLEELINKKVVKRRGKGPRTAYSFVRAGDDRRGRPRKWGPERIQSELEDFCNGRTSWPTVADFKENGRYDLYLAINRYGGARHWAEVVGLRR